MIKIIKIPNKLKYSNKYNYYFRARNFQLLPCESYLSNYKKSKILVINSLEFLI